MGKKEGVGMKTEVIEKVVIKLKTEVSADHEALENNKKEANMLAKIIRDNQIKLETNTISAENLAAAIIGKNHTILEFENLLEEK